VGTCDTLWDAFPTPQYPHGCLGTRCFPKAIKRGDITCSRTSRTYLMPSYPVHSSVSRHASTRAKPAKKRSLILSSVDTTSTCVLHCHPQHHLTVTRNITLHLFDQALPVDSATLTFFTPPGRLLSVTRSIFDRHKAAGQYFLESIALFNEIYTRRLPVGPLLLLLNRIRLIHNLP
jgi:hypothetical protein